MLVIVLIGLIYAILMILSRDDKALSLKFDRLAKKHDVLLKDCERLSKKYGSLSNEHVSSEKYETLFNKYETLFNEYENIKKDIEYISNEMKLEKMSREELYRTNSEILQIVKKIEIRSVLEKNRQECSRL